MKTKICSKCREQKPIGEFHKNRTQKDGFHNYCKECKSKNSRKWYNDNRKEHIKRVRKYQQSNKEKIREKEKEWYQNNKDKMREYHRKYRQEKLKWFREYKKTLNCEICPESRWWVLVFHHKDPSRKIFSISKLVGINMSKERILKEIKKCIVICANCHLDLHYKLERRDINE